jgi:hypothetical protein
MQFSDPNANLFGDGTPYGSPGASSPYGNMNMPYMGQTVRRRRRRGCLGCLILLLFVVLLLAGIAFAWNITIIEGPTVIKVGAHPTLIIESASNPRSVIHIHTGASGQIAIQPLRPLNLPFGPPETYQVSSDQQTIIYDLAPTLSGIFDITVPPQTDLKIDANDASVLIEGVSGQMALVTNSGLLTVQHCHVQGPSLLRNNSGVINVLHDQFSGSVDIDNNSGDLTFQGGLDAAGTYHFTENGGLLTVTLPVNSAAHIDASTPNGSIISSLPGTKVQQGASGSELHTDLGTAPRGQLTLYNNGARIMVNEQGEI